ncbi:hypothetical protein EJ08DRAFT_172658 [Tothia fuscella]|uniref:Uncharacterized protein n=1 Tax=Tothia fuscella TaxID=1048955 RepID=A0A9P4NU57_9PEZI|nr:hypothetical protein EJ08DRAFT_172658 [Tothia fuscella]
MKRTRDSEEGPPSKRPHPIETIDQTQAQQDFAADIISKDQRLEMPSSPKEGSLMGLSRELRMQIFFHLLPTTKRIPNRHVSVSSSRIPMEYRISADQIFRHCGYVGLRHDCRCCYTAIVRVNRQIKDECEYLLYFQKTFQIIVRENEFELLSQNTPNLHANLHYPYLRTRAALEVTLRFVKSVELVVKCGQWDGSERRINMLCGRRYMNVSNSCKSQHVWRRYALMSLGRFQQTLNPMLSTISVHSR